MLWNMRWLFLSRGSQDGATLVEYALIILLIAIALILSVTLLGTTVGELYSGIVANWPI